MKDELEDAVALVIKAQIATGHADTPAELMREVLAYVEELRAEVQRLDAQAQGYYSEASKAYSERNAARAERDEARVERERYKEAWKRANGLMEAMEDTR